MGRWLTILLVLLALVACEKEPILVPTITVETRGQTAINNEKKRMAKAQKSANSGALRTPKRKRPGVHAKSKVDYGKGKPGWQKKYRGQGR